MEYEIKKDSKKLTVNRKDELASGEKANSSLIITEKGINLQTHKNCHQ